MGASRLRVNMAGARRGETGPISESLILSPEISGGYSSGEKKTYNFFNAIFS